MTENPYASPAIPADLVADTAASLKEVNIASQTRRFVNLIIDNMIIQVLSAVAGFVIGLVFAIARLAQNGTITSGDENQMQLAGMLVGLVASVAYFVLMEALFQRTLAKFITGTMVVTASGGRPTFWEVVGRTFARFIPFEAFSFLGSNQPVGWHDSLSRTRVIGIR